MKADKGNFNSLKDKYETMPLIVALRFLCCIKQVVLLRPQANMHHRNSLSSWPQPWQTLLKITYTFLLILNRVLQEKLMNIAKGGESSLPFWPRGSTHPLKEETCHPEKMQAFIQESRILEGGFRLNLSTMGGIPVPLARCIYLEVQLGQSALGGKGEVWGYARSQAGRPWRGTQAGDG